MTYVVRIVAAALVAAAATLGMPTAPAHAGACTTDSGVTVVVDFNQLGGGVQQVCVAGGGGDSGTSLFSAAGFGLKYAQRQPGFVCRVNDVPQSDPCQNTAPADSFWSLWWSNGSGSWTYSSVGVSGLKVPDGGFIAFSWDQSSGTEPPSAGATTPAAPQPDPPPSDQAPGGNGGGNGGGDGGGSGDGPGTPDGSTSPGDTSTAPGDGTSAGPDESPGQEKTGMGAKGRDRGADPEATPTTPTTPGETGTPGAASDEGAVVADPPAGSDGLPGWVAPLLIGALFAAAGGVLFLRRRRSDA